MSAQEEFKDAVRGVIKLLRTMYPELSTDEIALTLAEILKQYVEEMCEEEPS